MKKAVVGFIAVTAGAPLAALAIGAPTAWAAPSGNGASVSINGTTHGSPNSDSYTFSTQSWGPKPNISVAVNGSSALTNAAGNKAIATNGSFAEAGNGSNNTTKAVCGGSAVALAGGQTVTSNGGTCGK